VSVSGTNRPMLRQSRLVPLGMRTVSREVATVTVRLSPAEQKALRMCNLFADLDGWLGWQSVAVREARERLQTPYIPHQSAVAWHRVNALREAHEFARVLSMADRMEAAQFDREIDRMAV
jgi:hypothetical protein